MFDAKIESELRDYLAERLRLAQSDQRFWQGMSDDATLEHDTPTAFRRQTIADGFGRVALVWAALLSEARGREVLDAFHRSPPELNPATDDLPWGQTATGAPVHKLRR